MKWFSLVKFVLFDLSWKNFYLYYRIKSFRSPISVFKSVHIHVAKTAKIIHKNGHLFLGRTWDVSRYRLSEIKICDQGELQVRGLMAIYTGFSIDILPGAKLLLGSGYISNDVRIVVFNQVSIGRGVAIAENVTIRDSDNHSINGSKNPVSAPITIGNRVWIGMNATILKGVSIGNGAVVAANALVNKDVPAGCLVAGVPAKVVKTDVNWS